MTGAYSYGQIYRDAGAEHTSSDMGPYLVRGRTVSVFVEQEGEIILYKLYRTCFSCHLCCVTEQTVRSQNITYYGIRWPESKYGAVSGPQWKWKSGASRFPHVAKALV